MGFTLVNREWWLNATAYSFFVMTATWVAYNLFLLCWLGELIIWEDRVWIRVPEFIFALGIVGLAVERWINFMKKKQSVSICPICGVVISRDDILCPLCEQEFESLLGENHKIKMDEYAQDFAQKVTNAIIKKRRK